MSVAPSLPTERRFGLTFTIALSILGLYAVLEHWSWIAYGACFMGSAAAGLLTSTAPQALAPLNKAWFRLGMWLGKIVSPIVLGIIFFGILTPVAVITRLFGRDELHLRNRAVESYWRAPPRTAGHSFKNQF